ncbi:hypothetical protein H4Q26_015209 [Puccinia striiformis f. sp. tritici PST-130]|nr:hypothetical protein H4Q26_015209 [Puccinia striiformis f. sp. tritici PST-130]
MPPQKKKSVQGCGQPPAPTHSTLVGHSQNVPFVDAAPQHVVNSGHVPLVNSVPVPSVNSAQVPLVNYGPPLDPNNLHMTQQFQAASQHPAEFNQGRAPLSYAQVHSSASLEENESDDSRSDESGDDQMESQSSIPIPWSQTPVNTQQVSQGSVLIPWSPTQATTKTASFPLTQSLQPNMGSTQLGQPTLQSNEAPETPSQSNTSQPTNGGRNPKLIWSSAMEKSALRLHVQATEAGKRSDYGFKAEVHRWVAAELTRLYTGNQFDNTKCKSKLSQTFKKEHDAFEACRAASGFGWDNTQCELTACKEVWDQFIVSDPAARRFRNQPFPEWHDLASFLALLNQLLPNHNILVMLMTKVRAKTIPAADVNVNAIVRPPGQPFEAPYKSLSVPGRAVLTNNKAVAKAIEMYQDGLTTDLSMQQTVAGFSVLEIPAKACVFIQLNNSYKPSWLKYQIGLHLGANSSANHVLDTFEDI